MLRSLGCTPDEVNVLLEDTRKKFVMEKGESCTSLLPSVIGGDYCCRRRNMVVTSERGLLCFVLSLKPAILVLGREEPSAPFCHQHQITPLRQDRYEARTFVLVLYVRFAFVNDNGRTYSFWVRVWVFHPDARAKCHTTARTFAGDSRMG